MATSPAPDISPLVAGRSIGQFENDYRVAGGEARRERNRLIYASEKAKQAAAVAQEYLEQMTGTHRPRVVMEFQAHHLADLYHEQRQAEELLYQSEVRVLLADTSYQNAAMALEAAREVLTVRAELAYADACLKEATDREGHHGGDPST